MIEKKTQGFSWVLCMNPSYYYFGVIGPEFLRSGSCISNQLSRYLGFTGEKASQAALGFGAGVSDFGLWISDFNGLVTSGPCSATP